MSWPFWFFFASSPWKSIQIYRAEQMANGSKFWWLPWCPAQNNTCAKVCNTVSVAQLVTTFIFFSAWEKSCVKWDNSRNSSQKMKTYIWPVRNCLTLQKDNFKIFLTKWRDIPTSIGAVTWVMISNLWITPKTCMQNRVTHTANVGYFGVHCYAKIQGWCIY